MVNTFVALLRACKHEDFLAQCNRLRVDCHHAGLVVTRSYHLKVVLISRGVTDTWQKYPKCFKGRDLVTFLVENGTCATRAEATLLGCVFVILGMSVFL